MSLTINACQTEKAVFNERVLSNTATVIVKATPTTIPPTAVPVHGPSDFPAGMNPLTGMIVEDPRLLERCPMIIKVSNYPRTGRPHAGLSKADLVFDYYIGEGMNRFAAVYYGQNSKRVGPIRSGRLVDAQLATLYQSVLAFKGAWFKVNDVLYSTLKTRAISGSPATCPGICDEGNETVISMFANTTELEKYVIQKDICNKALPPLGGMVFSEIMPPDGRPVAELAVAYNAYNRAEWRFDEVSGAYLRWIESVSGEEGMESLTMVPLLDANSGEQLAFNNVVILFAQHDLYAPTYFDIQLQQNTSGARAVLFRDGKAFDAVWKTVEVDQPLRFFTPEGEYLAFKPGNSWLVIVGAHSILKTPPDQMWELINYLP